MKKPILLLSALCCFLGGSMAKDAPGTQDPKDLKRITGSEIFFSSSAPFDAQQVALERVEYNYNTQKFKENRKLEIEGSRETAYYKMAGAASTLEAVRQYQAELEGRGFELLFEAANQKLDDGYNRFVSQIFPEALKLKQIGYLHQFNHEEQRYAAFKGKTQDGGDQYVTLYAMQLVDSGTSGYADLKKAHGLEKGTVVVRVDVITPKPMTQRMELVKAEAITQGIEQQGKVIIYGVYFATDRADIESESEPALAEMAKAIAASEAGQRFLIVGHTDNQGSYEHNLALSSKRAAAVVDALIKRHQADAKKLLPVGVGMAAPVQPNTTEEGRAKNRRVEIVAM